MPIDILMPQLSPTMTEGRLATWLVDEGASVNSGDVIAEVETDKATMEVEASEDGVVHKIIGEIGTDIQVGVPIAILKEDGEDVPADYKPTSRVAEKEEEVVEASAPVDAPVKASSAPVAAAPKLAPAVSTKAPTVTAAQTVNTDRISASPVAKRLAAERGVNLNMVSGSGPNGRITKKDVEMAQAGGVVTRRDDSAVKHTPMRKSIAARLTGSKQQVPHFYLNADVNMDALLEARKQMNALGEGAYKLTVNDFVLKACASALKKNPEANCSWYDDAIIVYGNVDISVAVAIEGGLITPILQNADAKGIVQVSQEMKALAKQAKEGKLQPEQYEGGGFSLSNLGMYGVKDFQAIVNPPQGAILAVGGAEKRPVVNDNGDVTVSSVMGISLSVDHRAIDGALGAELLRDIKFFLENPVTMFA